ncbi:MAG TPA: glycosyltransferase [Candidatus Aphodousia faecipullorum]|nr:glycosyltransferase [Candidatus Aphodousia faecipullorum]
MKITDTSLPNVSLVVVTRNRARCLRKTLECLRDQSVLGSSIRAIVVVDNASTDETPEVLESFRQQLPLLRIVRTGENIGGSGGFALGIRTAMSTGCDWIGVCDDDAAMEPDAVENILKQAKGRRILGCLRLNRKGGVAERASRFYNLANPFVLNPRQMPLDKIFNYPNELNELEEVAFCSFEGMFFPIELVREIGLPMTEFFIFGDDCDFCLRATKVGWKVYIVRDAQLTRLIDYDRSAMLNSWKAHYVVRNFFLLHFLHAENFLVRLKPFVLAPALTAFDLYVKRGNRPMLALCEALKLSRLIRSRRFIH